MELFVFVCAALMVFVGAAGVITRSNPVHAALSLVLTLFGVAVMFVSLNAHMLAAVQVIVYAGAIVVLFLFVIMLLGVDRAENLKTEPLSAQRPLAAVLSLGIIGLVVAAIVKSRDTLTERSASLTKATLDDPDGNVRQIAHSIFGDYVFAFEVTSVLLLIAVVGTVLLARKARAVKEAQ
jgi:NADH-quinone oxidoreductase subunit J